MAILTNPMQKHLEPNYTDVWYSSLITKVSTE